MPPSATWAAPVQRPAALAKRPHVGTRRSCCGRLAARRAEPPGAPRTCGGAARWAVPLPPHRWGARQTSAPSPSPPHGGHGSHKRSTPRSSPGGRPRGAMPSRPCAACRAPGRCPPGRHAATSSVSLPPDRSGIPWASPPRSPRRARGAVRAASPRRGIPMPVARWATGPGPLATPPQSGGPCHGAWQSCLSPSRTSVGRPRDASADASGPAAPAAQTLLRSWSPWPGSCARFGGPWPSRSLERPRA